MITILLCVIFVGCCEGWLDEYFDVSNNDIVKNEAIILMKSCSARAETWEEAVRLRRMDEILCLENKLVDECEGKNTSEHIVAEYIKLLILDSKKLCHESFYKAVASQVTLLKKNSSAICSEILKEKSHTTCSILIVLSIMFSAMCLIYDNFRVQKYARRFLKRKRADPKKPFESPYVKCEKGIDEIEYPSV